MIFGRKKQPQIDMLPESAEMDAKDKPFSPKSNMKKRCAPMALGLAVASGVIGFSKISAPASDRRRLEGEELDKRIMEVTKEIWPECVNKKMTGVQCKNFIDEEILTLFMGDDKLTRTILVGKRGKMDEWYNTVVVYMDDNDLVLGRDGDGMIYFDWPWEGSGQEATPEQQGEIPPVIGTENPNGDPNCNAATNPKCDPTSPEYDPLDLEEEPILVEGASLAGARDGSDPRPINGGVIININIENLNVDRDTWLQQALAAADLAPVEAAGTRDIPAFDCYGLTGYNCCLMIKASVKDSDIYGKAIQCHLNFIEYSAKAKHFFNHRGKKVHIFTNHNFIVSKVPEVVGSWPGGADNLTAWVEDGGEQDLTGLP